jgi:hypothetical protein
MHPGRRPADGAEQRALAARVGAIEMRRLRLLATRRLALASLATWMQVWHRVLPDLVEWVLVLTAVGLAVLVAVYAGLEYRCRRRAARQEQVRIVIHDDRSLARDVRVASWSALALVSLLPTGVLLLHTALPAGLLLPLVECVLGLLALVLVLEALRATASTLRARSRAASR